MVICSGFGWPHRLTPTVSPTETMSAPAMSAMRAIWWSQATTQTLFSPAAFMA